MKNPENKNLLLKQRVGKRLLRIANVLLLNASFIDNPGLLNGKMGIAIFLYHYSRYSKNKIFGDYAGELIDEIYEEINTNTPLNFSNGLTGIGWGIEYLVKNGFVQADTDEALSEIDTSVYRNSLYRPFLLESGNDLFGYCLYFIARLRERGNDDENLNTLFKKQHLIYLTDDCERILVHKKYLDYKIESLSIDTIISFIWFLLEMHRMGIFPFKVEKLLHVLPEHIGLCLQDAGQISGVDQLPELTETVIATVKDSKVKTMLKAIMNSNYKIAHKGEVVEDEIEVRSFIHSTWQQLVYEPYIICEKQLPDRADKIFQIVNNEENWDKRLDNINKNNIGLTGLAGLGLGMLRAQGRIRYKTKV